MQNFFKQIQFKVLKVVYVSQGKKVIVNRGQLAFTKLQLPPTDLFFLLGSVISLPE